MSWIFLLLVYLAIAAEFCFFFRVVVLNENNKRGPAVVLSSLWPLVITGVVLYFVGKVFACVIKKACEICGKKSST